MIFPVVESVSDISIPRAWSVWAHVDQAVLTLCAEKCGRSECHHMEVVISEREILKFQRIGTKSGDVDWACRRDIVGTYPPPPYGFIKSLD